jgi:predicted DNA binding CopG/RHH family protein
MTFIIYFYIYTQNVKIFRETYIMPKGKEKIYDRLINFYANEELLQKSKKSAANKGLSLSENIRLLLEKDSKKTTSRELIEA